MNNTFHQYRSTGVFIKRTRHLNKIPVKIKSTFNYIKQYFTVMNNTFRKLVILAKVLNFNWNVNSQDYISGQVSYQCEAAIVLSRTIQTTANKQTDTSSTHNPNYLLKSFKLQHRLELVYI